MTEEKRLDQPVRWTRDELAWGRANPDVHGLGEELDRLTPAATDDGGDEDEQTYIITATGEKIADAVTRVNEYLADSPGGGDGGGTRLPAGLIAPASWAGGRRP